jgi:hypothetical protein
MIKHRGGRCRTNALSNARLGTPFGFRECGTCMGLWANFIPLVIIFVSLLPVSAHANGLESPEIAHGVVSTLVVGDAQSKRMTPGNNVDLANESGGP